MAHHRTEPVSQTAATIDSQDVYCDGCSDETSTFDTSGGSVTAAFGCACESIGGGAPISEPASCSDTSGSSTATAGSAGTDSPTSFGGTERDGWAGSGGL